MEIPEINMISNFEAGMNCLQNPSLISRFFAFPGQQVFIFWKWGALIFAIFATFGSLIRRIKLLFIHFRILKSSSSSSHHKEEVFDFSEEDDQISLASTSSDDEEYDRNGDDDDEDDGPPRSTSRNGVVEDFRVKSSNLYYKAPWQTGQLRQRRRRSNSSSVWSEFTSGKNVVKLWDSLGFNLDFNEDLINLDPHSVVSTWEINQLQKETELSGGVWNVPAASPTVLLTAKDNGKGDGVVLSGYDSRMRRRVPAIYAEWKSAAEKVVGGVAAGGVGKVYVRDDVSGAVTVGDVRNVRKALENGTEGERETWWDAEAVMVDEKFQDSR